MPVEELKNELLAPVSDFWRGEVAQWLDAVDERFLETLEARDWWPGVSGCLNTFAGDVPPQVVWLGESPYEGEDRATGFSFLDGRACQLFCEGALHGTINKTTSLRNILKAWFRADGRLQEGRTQKEDVREMDKDGLVQHVTEIFEHGVADGWLWLNAGLSIGGHLEKSTHLCGWWPLVSRAVTFASEANAQIVLLGDWAKTYRSDVVAETLLVETVHPRCESFVEDAEIRAFLREWRHLIHA